MDPLEKFQSTIMANEADNYSGPERRECVAGHCLDHRAHIVTMEGLSNRIGSIEAAKPISFGHFKWTIGIMITIFLTLFSMSLYSAREVKEELTQVRIQQERMINRIEGLQEQIKGIKNGV